MIADGRDFVKKSMSDVEKLAWKIHAAAPFNSLSIEDCRIIATKLGADYIPKSSLEPVQLEVLGRQRIEVEFLNSTKTLHDTFDFGELISRATLDHNEKQGQLYRRMKNAGS